MKLKFLSKYIFDMQDGRVIVKNINKRPLNGKMLRDYRKVYTLVCDDGKKRDYGENVLAFYYNNPHMPALCNNFRDAGVHFTMDGEIKTEIHRARRYDVFSSIDEALETVLLIKAYQQGNVSPILTWLTQARENALYTVTKFGHCSVGKAKLCLDGADMRFWQQLETFNVHRIMPLFAMYCKCLKQEILSNKTALGGFVKPER